MQLWPAIIASPPSTRCMLMVCLIIVRFLAEDKVCSWGKAHADPLVSMSRAACAFFCGDGPPARVPCNARKRRDAHLTMSEGTLLAEYGPSCGPTRQGRLQIMNIRVHVQGIIGLICGLALLGSLVHAQKG